MQLSALSSLLALVFAITVAANPAPAAGPIATPAPDLVHLDKRACAADNCLRALRNSISTAEPFCRTYTTETAATIPTWATGPCATNPTRVTSACGCLATGTLTQVYGPTDNTNYTIFEQAVNINSRPSDTWENYFQQCFDMCVGYGAMCQTFSYAQMGEDDGTPGGLYLCYM